MKHKTGSNFNFLIRPTTCYVGIAYKLRNILPLSARSMIFNSQFQSHLNYFSLVWGSNCKSNVESLFTSQKKAIRSIMPGHVNYYYNNGTCPTHTKPSFTDFNILTVHNVILKNIMIFMNRIHNFPSSIPISVKNTISPSSPSPYSNTDYNSDWYCTYNRTPYNTSTFFKGPLLYTNIMTDNPQLHANASLNCYKQRMKSYLLEVQCSGDSQEWEQKISSLPICLD